MSEVAKLAPSYGGISYERLEGDGLQWPCPNMEHPGTGYLHKGQFTRGLGKFNVVDYRPSMELPDEEYPFILTTGRVLCQYHTGTMTRKVGDLNILRGEELVEMNPQDALTLGIVDGELIEVTSRRGSVRAKAKTTEKSPVRRGLYDLPFLGDAHQRPYQSGLGSHRQDPGAKGLCREAE